MKFYVSYSILGIIFLGISALLYLFHYFVFHDTYQIFLWMIGNLAFLPVEVFLVVIVIERILAQREKKAILQKLNMVIGAFFSEVGNKLLNTLLGCFENSIEFRQRLVVEQKWTQADFKNAVSYASTVKYEPQFAGDELEQLKIFLVGKRSFLLGLLENPNLLEHERFTDLLWATFHLTEELEARQSFKDLPATDLAHLSGDTQRVYHHLAAEWLLYVEHLKLQYPYLFSLIVRMQPFREAPSPLVR